MRNFNGNADADAVLGWISGATDRRAREVSEAYLDYDFGLKQVASSAQAA
jgi:hypothetical protein